MDFLERLTASDWKTRDLIKQHNGNSLRVFADGKCADGGQAHEEMLVKYLSSGDVFHRLPDNISAKDHIRHNQKRKLNRKRYLCKDGQRHADSVKHGTCKQTNRQLFVLCIENGCFFLLLWRCGVFAFFRHLYIRLVAMDDGFNPAAEAWKQPPEQP